MNGYLATVKVGLKVCGLRSAPGGAGIRSGLRGQSDKSRKRSVGPADGPQIVVVKNGKPISYMRRAAMRVSTKRVNLDEIVACIASDIGRGRERRSAALFAQTSRRNP